MDIKQYVEQYVSVTQKAVAASGSYLVYEKALSGFNDGISQAEHFIPQVNSVTVRKSDGTLVDVSIRINSSQDVIISSNISLDGHTAVIS